MKACLILGAGATFADAVKKGFRYEMPPLDKNFFWNHHVSYSLKKENDGKIHKAWGWNIFIMRELNSYFRKRYGYDIYTKDSPNNSLEKVLQILYADIFISETSKEAEDLLIKLISFLNNLVSTSTGRIKISMRNRLTSVIKKLLEHCDTSEDLTIISYNYDLQVEKTLQFLSKKHKKFSSYFDFPNCYRLPSDSYVLTFPKDGSTDSFDLTKQKSDKNLKGVKILKPHGSLNWFSIYSSRISLLSHINKPKKSIMISRRSKIPKELTFKGKKTFPFIIPPLSNKGMIFRKSIIDKVWNDLRKELSNSDRLVFYGYSCPEADIESFNLFSQVFTESHKLKELDIINPDASVINRLQSAIKAPIIHYYNSADYYKQG